MVQFRITRLFGVKVAVEGMLIAKAQGLHLVFHQPEHDATLREANIQAIELPWTALSAVQCEYGLLTDSVTLQVNSPAALASLPGATDEQVVLSIHKQHREELKAFETRVDECRRGVRPDKVEDLLDDVRDFLHGSGDGS